MIGETFRETDLLLVARQWVAGGPNTSLQSFVGLFRHSHVVSNNDALKRPYRLLKMIATRAGQEGYTSFSLGIEAAAFWRAVRYRPKVVHFLYGDHDYHYFGLAARHIGARLVASFWFSIEELERRMPDKSHLRHLDLVIASGRKQLEYLSQFVPPEKLTCLPLGVDTDFFTPLADNSARWQEPLWLLQTGANRRDYELLEAVYRRIRERYKDEVELHLVGSSKAKPLLRDTPGVVFHPFLTDQKLVQVYHRSVLLVLPLLEGGSSNALNEAMATGLPVVATAMPILEDYVSDDCVFLCPPGNPEAMAETCVRLLEDRQHWSVASERAKAFAEQFDWREVRRRLFGVYRNHFGFSITNGCEASTGGPLSDTEPTAGSAPERS